MDISTVKDTVKALAQSLQVSMVLPASLLVLANVYLILPLLLLDLDVASPLVTGIVIALTLMISYALYAFNFPLIRLLEGYKLRSIDFSRWLRWKAQSDFQDLLDEISELRKERLRFENHLRFSPDDAGVKRLSEDESRYWLFLKTKLAEREYRLDRHYPSTIHAVLEKKEQFYRYPFFLQLN